MAAIDSLIIGVSCSGPGGFPLASKTGFSVIALTAGNFTAQRTAQDLLESKYEQLTDGVVATENITITKFINSGYPAGTANRGSKWILTAQNAAGALFTYTIPGAPGNGELLTDNITADLAGTNWAAFKTAFEAVATDPNGAALTLLRAKLGGRRR